MDGFVNYLHATHLEGSPRALLERGINPIASLKTVAGLRRPAILISSSPHRVGSVQTPWHDVFDADNGHIRYFGDAKTPGQDPATAPGNKALLEAYAVHSAIEPAERAAATPIVFYRRTTVNGVQKGYLTFQGYGVIERVERLTQFDPRRNASFANYVYDFAVLAQSAEHELFDWGWINARRDPSLTTAQTQALAPAAWRNWIANGPSAIPRNRRHSSKLRVVKPREQMPEPGSRNAKILQQVYEYYEGRKARFEGLAYAITRRLLSGVSGRFTEGWITPGSGDGGADFIARLDIGQGFGAVRQIVYGQAKCIAPTSGVDGKDIARTVARLKRGWFGVFVTTSYFSEPVQREVIEDEYPVLLVAGDSVAENTFVLAEEAGHPSVLSFLEALDADFEAMKARRRPEEILHE
ncbi:restriction endonuclease [Brevundimonas sp. MYb46]|nr:restriction endonuclease [Brevundimonas sp. MYb31]PRA27646.1 restriction endonuclease [Brevundimonas sp. MYb27]PRB38007.1 restriction endonuclease [Brevundimonas sp. MYb46]